MASYDTLNLPICVGSRIRAFSDLAIERASNGSARGRSLYTSDKHEIMLVHKARDAAARAALDAFYAANQSADDIAVVFDGVTYVCAFAGPPQYAYVGGDLADVTVEFAEA